MLWAHLFWTWAFFRNYRWSHRQTVLTFFSRHLLIRGCVCTAGGCFYVFRTDHHHFDIVRAKAVSLTDGLPLSCSKVDVIIIFLFFAFFEQGLTLCVVIGWDNAGCAIVLIYSYIYEEKREGLYWKQQQKKKTQLTWPIWTILYEHSIHLLYWYYFSCPFGSNRDEMLS